MPDHLAVLRPFYLNLILTGRKSIECRLTRTAKPPFGVVAAGERIFLKKTSGPVLAVARAERVIFQRIQTIDDLEQIRTQFSRGIGATDEFWASVEQVRYCSLIFLADVCRLSKPFRISKKDMRGWVLLDGTQLFDWPGLPD